MATKRSFVINILEIERITDANNIIRKHADITMQSSSYVYFDAQPANPDDLLPDITFFTLESDGKKSADEKLDILIDELNQLDTDYAIRDEDSGKMIEYIKFVGVFNIGKNIIDRVTLIEHSNGAVNSIKLALCLALTATGAFIWVDNMGLFYNATYCIDWTIALTSSATTAFLGVNDIRQHIQERLATNFIDIVVEHRVERHRALEGAPLLRFNLKVMNCCFNIS